MSCNCAETNFMNGKGHDNGCPLKSPTLQEMKDRPIKMLCHKRITLVADRKETYCMRKLGHEGKCA